MGHRIVLYAFARLWFRIRLARIDGPQHADARVQQWSGAFGGAASPAMIRPMGGIGFRRCQTLRSWYDHHDYRKLIV